MVLVDVVAQRIGVVELLVALGTRGVVKRDMLGHAGSGLELYITWNKCTTLRSQLRLGTIKIVIKSVVREIDTD